MENILTKIEKIWVEMEGDDVSIKTIKMGYHKYRTYVRLCSRPAYSHICPIYHNGEFDHVEYPLTQTYYDAFVNLYAGVPYLPPRERILNKFEFAVINGDYDILESLLKNKEYDIESEYKYNFYEIYNYSESPRYIEWVIYV